MILHGKRAHVSVLFAAAAAGVLGAAQSVDAQERAYSIAPLALTGEPAPGTGGADFEHLLSWESDLNDAGDVVFIGSLGALDSFESLAGVWLASRGNVSLLARAGDPAPDHATLSFAQFFDARINDAGSVSVHATFATGGRLSGDGIWTGAGGLTDVLAITGDPAPGTPGFTFAALFSLNSFDDSGVTSFGANTSGNHGYWDGVPGILEPVILTGDPVPGTTGVTFTDILPPASNDTGHKVFLAYADDPDFNLSEGIWRIGQGGVDLVASTGQVAPGTGGRSFRDFMVGNAMTFEDTEEPSSLEFVGPLLSNIGDVLFSAYVDSPDPLNWLGDHGIWIHDPSGLRLIAFSGDLAPGTAGLPFLYFNHLNFNAAGNLAFDASLDVADPNRDHGIWAGPPDNPILIVREGDPAPGTTGESFGSLVMGPSYNDSGDMAFFARLLESGADGVWAGAATDLALVAREGEAIEVRRGDYRVIESITMLDGRSRGHTTSHQFNNAGQIVFDASFSDGSTGLFLATPIPASPNQAPVASAGPDQSVTDYQAVTLDGSDSFDPEGTILSFVWSVDGVRIASGPTTTLGPLAGGTYVVTLTVTDRSGASTSDDMVLTVWPNQPPVAEAGPDQTVTDLEVVTFDGSGSADPEGGSLEYSWSIGGVEFATVPTATVGPFVPGTFTVTLTVTDSGGASVSDTMTLTVLNIPPTAQAGPDRTIRTLETIRLDGSGSVDPEGLPLTYTWTLDGAQIGGGPSPRVGPFDAGTHTITLTVIDNYGASSVDDMVLTVLNRAPVASAGSDQMVNHSQTVVLDGSASSDPEGGPLSFDWSLGGELIAAGRNPAIGPFAVGTYHITLTVTDDHGETAADGVTITVINEVPVANAGPDQTVQLKGKTALVTLDGSVSADPEGGALSYHWTLDGQTVGTAAVAQTELGVGTYSFMLTVTDDHGATASDTVVVTVSRGRGA